MSQNATRHACELATRGALPFARAAFRFLSRTTLLAALGVTQLVGCPGGLPNWCQNDDQCPTTNACSTGECEASRCVYTSVLCSDGKTCNSETGECSCVAIRASAACVDAPQGLVAWWTFNVDGTDVQNGLDGTLSENGAEVVASGVVSQALSLDGNGYVEVEDDPALTTPSGLTLDAWVKPTTITTDGAIVSKYNSFLDAGEEQGDEQISWYLGLLADGGLRLTVCNDEALIPGNCTGVDSDEPVLTAGCWHFVAATFEVTTPEAEAEAKIYVDGEEVPSSTNIEGMVDSIADSDAPVHVGTFTPISGDKANFWSGLIDELEIYDRALTPTQIEGIYNASNLGKCEPNPAQ